MKRLFLVLILALLLRIWPFWSPHLVGDADPYYHVRIAAGGGAWDALSYGGRVQTYPPAFHWLLQSGHFVFGDWFLAAKIIPVLLGLATVGLIYLLGKSIYGERTGLLAAAILATFPLHVQRTATFARPDCLLVFFFVLIPWLAYTKRWSWLPFATAGMMLTSFGWPYGLVIIAILLASMRLEKLEVKKAAIGIGAGLLLAAVYWIPFFLKNGLPLLLWRASEQAATRPDELVMALTFFAIVVAAGSQSVHAGKYFVPLWAAFSAGTLVLGIRMLVYLSVPLALCLGMLWDEHLFRRWKLADLGSLENVKENVVRVAVAAVIIAFFTASLAFISGFGPEASDGEFEAFYWVGENLQGQMVASAWELGHYVTYFGAKSLHDGYFEYAPDPIGREKAFNSLSSEVKKYGAGYLLVTREDCGRIGGDCLGLWEQDALFKNDKAVILQVG